MKRIFRFLLALLVLPACSSPSSELPSEPLTDRQQTLELLAAYHVESKEEHTNFGHAMFDRTEQQLAAVPNAPVNELYHMNMSVGIFAVRVGKNQRSVEAYTRAMELLDLMGGTTEQETEVLFRLAISWLRVGETENCINHPNCDRCIFPISADGIHDKKEGSEHAIEYLDLLLEKEPENLPARWLLNIAHMTLGNSLDEIPEAFRLPPQAFESDAAFPRFANIASDALIDELSLAGSVIADDFDNDQMLDLVVSNWNSNGQLRFFHNNGDGTFDDRSKQSGLLGFYAGLNLVQADYDNDGDLDILVLRGAWQIREHNVPNSLLQNDGEGRFTEVLYQAGLGENHYATQTATWLDHDLDGNLDLYIGNENAPCQLFHNDGTGHFVEIASQAGVEDGGYTKGVASGDYDGDGDPDLYVSNLNGDNFLYRNNRNGTFTDVAQKLGVSGPKRGFPTWFWDFNNDGKLDIFASSYDGNIDDIAASYFFPEKHRAVELDALYQGDGKGGFRDVAVEQGLGRPTLPMGANFGDLDNDGFLDFYLGTGDWYFYSLMPNLMFHNRQGNGFEDVTTAGGFGQLQKGHGIAFFDYDHDGDEDVFAELGGAYAADIFQNALFENPGFGNSWIKIQLVGSQTNRSGIGARIHLELDTEQGTRSIYRWVGNGSSFGANSLRQEIGLGMADTISRLEVFWPVSQTTQVFRDVPARGLIQISEGNPDFKTIPLPHITRKTKSER